MNLFGTVYDEHMPPQRGGEHNWHVWSSTGALEVLRSREYVRWLADHPGQAYTINFANNSSARIHRSHPLWQEMAEIVKVYSIKVFQLTLSGGYLEWTGESDSLRAFDAICIETK